MFIERRWQTDDSQVGRFVPAVQHVRDRPRHDHTVRNATLDVMYRHRTLAWIPVFVDNTDWIQRERVLHLLQEVGYESADAVAVLVQLLLDVRQVTCRRKRRAQALAERVLRREYILLVIASIQCKIQSDIVCTIFDTI